MTTLFPSVSMPSSRTVPIRSESTSLNVKVPLISAASVSTSLSFSSVTLPSLRRFSPDAVITEFIDCVMPSASTKTVPSPAVMSSPASPIVSEASIIFSVMSPFVVATPAVAAKAGVLPAAMISLTVAMVTAWSLVTEISPPSSRFVAASVLKKFVSSRVIPPATVLS